MPTLYVENVPDELYDALRARAKANRKSMSAEVLDLLSANVPTAAELARRKELVQLARKLRSRRAGNIAGFHSAEEMQREDRNR